MTEHSVGRTTRAIFLSGVMAQTGIVVTGGLVRLTGSGLGCPEWPTCTGTSYTPVVEQAQGYHSLIEFGNRLLTFVVTIVAVACIVAAWRQLPRRMPLVWLACAGLLGIVGQAILGGVTVLTDLHPATVAAHFLLSMVLIAFAVALYHRGNESGDGPRRWLVPPLARRLSQGVIVAAAGVLALGTVVTGSGPHSGDAEHPARFGLDAQTMSWLHADAVLVFLGLVACLGVVLAMAQGPARAQRHFRFLLGAVVLQGLIGYLQYFTELPVALVALHMLGACLVWICVWNVVLSMRVREAPGIPEIPSRSADQARPQGTAATNR